METLLVTVPGKYEVTLRPQKYLFECWGAQGGFIELNESGRGAYVSGVIHLRKKTKMFLFVGEKGKVNSNETTFNGGGAGFYAIDEHDSYSFSSSGGGATDIRLKDGDWDNNSSLISRIIIAAGGGGEIILHERRYSYTPAPGGFGGTIRGGKGNHSHNPGSNLLIHDDATGGEQTKGGEPGGGDDFVYGNKGSFGKGGSANPCKGNWQSSGGGGG